MARAGVASPKGSRLDPRAVVAALVVPLLAVAIALALGTVAVAVSGEDPLAAYGALLRGAVGTPQAVANTLLRALPIAIAGLGVAVAFRSGVFNLGGEGQMIMGALSAAAVANALPGLPAPLAPIVALVAGCLAGAAWALVPALLQVRLEIPVLITTLLLNYVAALFASWAVSHPLRDLTGGAAVAQTALIPEAARFPVLPGTRLHLGVVALVVLPAILVWLFRRTVVGYEWRMTGANRRFAEYGGIRAGARTVSATLVSAGICGLAGVLLVLGTSYRYQDTVITSAGYAWTGFIAAVVALAAPVLTVVAGIFLAGLQVGAAGMARATEVPLQLVDVVQATIILVVATRPAIRARVRRALGIS